MRINPEFTALAQPINLPLQDVLKLNAFPSTSALSVYAQITMTALMLAIDEGGSPDEAKASILRTVECHGRGPEHHPVEDAYVAFLVQAACCGLLCGRGVPREVVMQATREVLDAICEFALVSVS
jgi:hypothetical protein